VVKVRQTKEVQFKLDGLVLLIEGKGAQSRHWRRYFPCSGALAYDDCAKVYHFRAYKDGRYLDVELKVPQNGFEWGFKAGPVDVRFAMHLNDKGEWVETGDTKFGDNPAQRSLEMTLRRLE
jgi:hypothetical protein